MAVSIFKRLEANKIVGRVARGSFGQDARDQQSEAGMVTEVEASDALLQA